MFKCDLLSNIQVFDKPFDAPAILVVGHQTDGKSGEDLSPQASIAIYMSHNIGDPAIISTHYCNPYTHIITLAPCPSPGRSTHGFPVQLCRRRHENPPPHRDPHEVQCLVRTARVLPAQRRWHQGTCHGAQGAAGNRLCLKSSSGLYGVR